MDEKLVKTLNPKLQELKSGDQLVVANTALRGKSTAAGAANSPSGDARKSRKLKKPTAPRAAKIVVSLSLGSVSVLDTNDRPMAIYPASVGSEATPTPPGSYSVTRIVRNPTYAYDPEKNFRQGKNTEKLTLPPGPNNPVGIVWIALSKPTFGFHGTPEPSKVSKTESHGCVRLTNWDAEELASLVRKGTRVEFIE